VDYLLNIARAGIMPALLVFVIGKTPFQIVGDAGVDAVVGATD